VPTLVLASLHPDLQPSFRFEAAGANTVALDGRTVVRIAFREVGRPTVIRGKAGTEGVPARGTVWIAPRDGAVARTELHLEDPPGTPGLEARLETLFRPVPAFALWLPVEMRDRWDGPARSYFFESKATYSTSAAPGSRSTSDTTCPSERAQPFGGSVRAKARPRSTQAFREDAVRSPGGAT
jgi:hypothetical protein